MFPTTLWTTIRAAAARDGDAMQRFAERYRPPILAFLRSRGFKPADAEDVCQDVFVRLLAGEVLAKADPQRGRLRSLLLAVTTHVMGDHARKRMRRRDAQPLDDGLAARLATNAAGVQVGGRTGPAGVVRDGPAAGDDGFDSEWALHLAETALRQLESESPTYFRVLRDHLTGTKQDRQRLWRARRRLVAIIRREIAATCASPAEFEDEVAYLSRFLRPGKQDAREDATVARSARAAGRGSGPPA